jgi:3-dehydroquinate synthase
LLTGDADKRLRKLLEKRGSHYASFKVQVDTTGKNPEDVTWEIQVKLGMFQLRGMESHKHPAYDVRVFSGGIKGLGGTLKDRELRGPVAVVTDENVGPVYLPQITETLENSEFEVHTITIPAGEQHKALETVAQLWDAFSSAEIERVSTIVAVGGGVVGDLTGFAASTWLRGVPWVAVPTSLLAMVDASMGGKTGADLPQGKNLIGAFYPPRLVIADPEVLVTLPKVELINGMAEVVKHGVIADSELFELCKELEKLDGDSLPNRLVNRAMAVKVKIIEEDPYEKGLRAALNFGHTVGHGVELESGFQIKHGEAVAIGMVAETQIAEEIGLAEPGLAEKIADVLRGIGLPTDIPHDLNRAMIYEAMQRDKKKAGGIVRFALPVTIGDMRVGVEVENWQTLISEL